MLQTLVSLLDFLPQGPRRAISRAWYEYLSHLDRDADMLLMNYGWADLDPDAAPLLLSDDDECERYCLQLYHHLARGVDLQDLDVLEIGSGRGGGASYLMRYFKPRSVVGVDITTRAIRFCDQHYAIEGLSFERGDAQALHFGDESFDVIVNVESSHCYACPEDFLRGVHRVLRPGGHFLLADFRRKEEIEALHRQLSQTGLTVIKEETIAQNVLRALDIDNPRKLNLIRDKVPRMLRGPFNEFAGMKGTRASYSRLKSGELDYLSFVLRK